MRHCASQFLPLIFFVVLIAGCAAPSAASSPQVAATATMVPYPTATPTPITISQTPLTEQQAWGNVHDVQFPSAFGARLFNLTTSAVTDDDQVCGVLRPASFDVTSTETVTLMNLHTGQLTQIHQLPTGYQEIGCVATGDWLIWMEGYGDTVGSLHSQLSIVAFNRQTQEMRQLDQGSSANGQSPQGAVLLVPSASNGYVTWTTIVDAQGDTDAVLYNLATQHKTTLAQHADHPALSWPWAAWDDGVQKGVVFKNLQTNQQILFAQEPGPWSLNSSAFVTQDANATMITLYPALSNMSRSEIIGQSINGDFVQDPYVNDRLVTWDSNDTLFAFDRKLQRLVQIPVQGNPLPLISSHYFIWGDKTSWHVLDTNALP